MVLYDVCAIQHNEDYGNHVGLLSMRLFHHLCQVVYRAEGLDPYESRNWGLFDSMI